MIRKDNFHVLNYIKKEEYLGSMEGMRYMLQKSEDGDTSLLEAIIWPQPYSYGKTPADKKRRQTFAFSETGLESAVDWLNDQCVSSHGAKDN